MRSVVLTRQPSTDQGTFGLVTISDSDLRFCSAELPWRGNAVNLSCIPERTYLCKWLYSPRRRGYCYHLLNVPDRLAIEIHRLTFAGDVKKNYKSDTEGCIGIGSGLGYIDGQTALLGSRASLWAFEDLMHHQDFNLTIKGESR